MDNEMELEERTPHETSSSSSTYCSTLKELHVASSSVYTSAVEDAEESTSSRLWTSGVPPEEVQFSDYDAVLQHGKRPKLPSHLNLKLKDFLGRCWHQDPEARPMSKEIVIELRELHKELITGSELVLYNIEIIFRDGRSSLDMMEASLLELKTLLETTLVKYDQPDYLVLLMEVVADIEEYQSTFGLRSMKEHHVLPYQEHIARLMMYDRFVWKYKVFGRLIAHIVEMAQMSRLYATIFGAMDEGVALGRP